MTFTLGNIYCNYSNMGFPKSFTAIFTANNKWFPLIRDYYLIKDLIAETISGDPMITFDFDPLYASVRLQCMAYNIRSIDCYGILDSGKYIQLTMSNEFTWRHITNDIFQDHFNNLDDGISEGDWIAEWFFKKNKPCTNYALYDEIYRRLAGMIYP